MPEINGINVPFLPAGGTVELKRQTPGVGRTASGISFDDIFQIELQRLKFSGNVQTKMISREISLSETETNRLEDAVAKAEKLGVSNTLVMFNDKAFIVNVQSRTVSAVIGQEQLVTDVITNIDSAVRIS